MSREEKRGYMWVDKELAVEWLPERPWDGHKGTFGKVCVVGGSTGLTGAPVFAAGAAARTGSGLVFVGVPEKIYPITASMCLEAMAFPLPDKEGRISSKALFSILERMNNCDAAVLGPGLGRSQELIVLVRRILEQVRTPLVLDADALYAIREHKDVLKRRCEKGWITILTPHEGEFAYLDGGLQKEEADLSGEAAREVRREKRIEAAEAFAKSYGCILVLKGPETVTADADGTVFVNTTGNNGMAKGGSGDVLSGMIASLLGQGVEPVKAAALGVWLHGTAGDLCKEELGEFGMLPRDMVEKIPAAILSLQNPSKAI